MNGEKTHTIENYIDCRYCPDAKNLPINIICSKCSRPLFRLSWLHFSAFLLTFLCIGFLMGYFSNFWIPCLIAESGILLYFILLLREKEGKKTIFIMFFIVIPSTFLIFFANLNESGLYFTIYLLVALIICYFFITYFRTWRDACNDYDTTLLRGFSVVTFSILLFMLIFDFLLSQYGETFLNKEIVILGKELTPLKIMSFLKSNNRLKGIFFIATVVHIMFVALINAIKNKISRPTYLFESKTKINFINVTHENPLLNIAFKLAQTIINIFLHIYRLLVDLLKMILNVIKMITEYFFEFMKNYAVEIFRISENFINIFVKTNYYFLKKYFFPLFVLLGVLLQTNFLIKNIFGYVQNGSFSFVGKTILNIIVIFIGIIIYTWLISEYKLIETINSVSVSNIWFVFITFIFIIISSWILWIASQFIDNLPFKKVGIFTIASSILIVLFLISIPILKSVKPEIFEKK